MDTQLDVHSDLSVNGRLKQLDATYPDSFDLRCGDLAAGFTHYHWPACHQRHTLQTGTWITTTV